VLKDLGEIGYKNREHNLQVKELKMARKFGLVLVLVCVLSGGVWAMDFAKINSNLGPSSFVSDIYVGGACNNLGANFEWGINDLPLTLGLGLSPFIIGEYALRAGYHPDLGVKGLDAYANLSLGLWNTFMIPLFIPQFGIHLGARYFFGQVLGAFAEVGWAYNANFVKLGVALKKRK